MVKSGYYRYKSRHQHNMSQASLLIEFLTEELPPLNIENGVGSNFTKAIAQELSDFLTIHSKTTTIISPRRFGCLITNVKSIEESRENLRKGPAITNGLKDNNPTPALIGFAKSCGLAWSELIQDTDGYFYAKQQLEGRTLSSVLLNAINNSLKKLAVGKYMRWGNNEYSFIRPVHNLLILHGNEIIHLNQPIFGLSANNKTFGHRVMSNGQINIHNADEYLDILYHQGKVIAEFDKRRKLIEDSLQTYSKKLNLNIHHSSGLLDEVTALVEYPVVLQGEFSAEFLSVPQECLILSMAKNQKYFALLDANGKLSNKFLFVANIDSPKPEIIIKGNEKVLSARLADAKFFFDVDKKLSLQQQAKKLSNVTYHNKLGNQKERNKRLMYIAERIAPMLGVNPEIASYTANLMKADLVTEMVGEFPELQGVMGKYYAINDGETLEVANAIEQHYYPRFSGDVLPDNNLATVMALSDKLETLVGIWGIGLIPTGDKDPYALRRAALGIVRILLEHPLKIYSLLEITAKSFNQQSEIKLADNTISETYGFILDRLTNFLTQTYKITCVKAIVEKQKFHNTEFTFIPGLLSILQNFADDITNKPILEANKRIENILNKNREDVPALNTDISFNKESIEASLWNMFVNVAEIDYGQNWNKYFATLSEFNQPITNFFDNVMVMTDDLVVRKNRIGLLQHLYFFFNKYAKLSELN